MHWLWIHLLQETGISNSASRAYDAWSGVLSDLGEVAIIGGLVAMFRKHNCHVQRCWKLGKHPVEGTAYVVCKSHHPTVPDRITAQHIAAKHRANAR